MRQMCLSCLGEALGNQQPNPLALGAAGQLPAAPDRAGTPLCGVKPRPAENRGQVALSAAGLPSALPLRPAGAALNCLLQQLRRELRAGV